MEKSNIMIRLEKKEEYQKVENLVRESFWMIRKLIWEIKWSLNSEETGVLVFWQTWILSSYVHMKKMVKIQNF